MKIVRHKMIECIGCDQCVEIAPDYWFMNEEGLAELYTSVKKTGEFYYAEVHDSDAKRILEAQEECPVDIIQLNPKD